MFQKLISMFLSALILLFSLVPAALGAKNEETFSDADVAQLHSLRDYIDYIQTNGMPSLSTDVFLNSAKPAANLRRLLSGKLFNAEEDSYLQVTLNDTLTEMCDYIADNSGLDIVELLQHVPNLNGPAQLCTTVLQLDTKNFRAEMYRLRDQAYAEGKNTLGALLYIFGAYFSVIEDVKIYTTPYAANPDELVVTLDVTYSDGETQTMLAYIVIDPETGYAHSIEEKGILKLGFDVDIYDLVLYATINCWQRNFGFTLLYDVFSATRPLFNYTTRRFHFDYDGKEWMIQIWKGNYALITNGAEVGVYHRASGSSGIFYASATDDEMMEMTMSLYHGDDLIFTRGPQLHWWQNGFKLSKVLYHPDDMTLTFSIVLPNETMLDAFTAAIDADPMHDVSYTVDGLTLKAVW